VRQPAVLRAPAAKPSGPGAGHDGDQRPLGAV